MSSLQIDATEYLKVVCAREQLLSHYLHHVKTMKTMGKSYLKLSRFVEIVLKDHVSRQLFVCPADLFDIEIPVFIRKTKK